MSHTLGREFGCWCSRSTRFRHVFSVVIRKRIFDAGLYCRCQIVQTIEPL